MFTGIVVRDSGGGSNEVLTNYELIAAARKGVTQPTDLKQLGLLTTVGGAAPAPASTSRVLDINTPPSGAATVHPGMLFLRIEPAPERVSIEVSAEGQQEPIVYAPAATSFSRTPGTRSITFETIIDNILTPKVMGVGLDDWMTAVSGKNWISDYLTFLEALTIPLPALGRKPWLALKHGNDLHGAGRFGLQLEGISSSDERHGPNGLQSAKVQLRFREYLVV